MTLLIVLAGVATYLTIGAFYARSQAVAVHRRAYDEWAYADIAEDSITVALALRALLWPLAAPFDLTRGAVRGWMRSPIEARRAEARRLTAEADQYDVLIRGCTDPAERDLMRSGQAALRQQAREIDL